MIVAFAAGVELKDRFGVGIVGMETAVRRKTTGRRIVGMIAL